MQTASSQSWKVLSNLPGRLRIHHPGLRESTAIRMHCKRTLYNCHWLNDFRINTISSTVCIRFPDRHRIDLIDLLHEIFDQVASAEGVLHTLLKQDDETIPKETRNGLKHISGCGLLLFSELFFPIPPLLFASATIFLLIPLFKEVFHKLYFNRKITVEALELGFSSVLITQGLAAEAVLDSAFTKATSLIQTSIDEDSTIPTRKELIEHFGERFEYTESLTGKPIKLKDLKDGDQVIVLPQTYILLDSVLVEGEVIIYQGIVDNDWRPLRISPGDKIKPGSFLMKGEGVVLVSSSLDAHSIYQLPNRPDPNRLFNTKTGGFLSLYKRFMAPSLFFLGSFFFLSGSIERSLSAYQFNPIEDWETSDIAAKFTALVELRMQGVHIRNMEALRSIGCIRHLIIARRALDKIGGIRTRECINPKSNHKSGFLIELLAGVQNYLIEEDHLPNWSNQLRRVPYPISVDSIDMDQPLGDGWFINLDGNKLKMLEKISPSTSEVISFCDVLEFWDGDSIIGHIELLNEPDPHWKQIFSDLKELGIDVHIVGLDSKARIADFCKPFDLDAHKHIYGNYTGSQRLDLVKKLQANNKGVAVIGEVLEDMPALSQADVSIGINTSSDAIFSSDTCDIFTGEDITWIVRLIYLSRELQRTTSSNFYLIGLAHLISSAAAAASVISPLQSILLADLPLIISEIRNLATVGKKHRA